MKEFDVLPGAKDVEVGNITHAGYQQCTRCVLDSTVEDIQFDKPGVCNYCKYYDELSKRTVLRDREIIEAEFKNVVSIIKKVGAKNKYDCVLGVSGGLDSTYLALVAKRVGLRPLLVHFDNGWNSEIAVNNIEKIVNKFGFQLHTFVMDWEEFRELQRAYFLASVVDVEVPTDQLIFAALHRIAYKNRIRFILAGNNIVSESINPNGWVFKRKMDLVNLRDIFKKYGKGKLSRLPKLGLYERYFYEAIVGIQTVNLLNLLPYHKSEVKKEIEVNLGWIDYGGKHFESVFTRFYQGYYLPKKYNIDKRKAHLSNLILSGQMNRDEALKVLETPPYSIHEQLEDEEYVKKKLNFSDSEWHQVLNAPHRSHESFATELSSRYQVLYFIFKAIMYLPVRILRGLSILNAPIKVYGGW